MSIFSDQQHNALRASVLVLAASGAALAIGVNVAAPVLDSSAAQECPQQRDLGTAVRLARKDPKKVCELSIESQGHRELPGTIGFLTELKHLDARMNKLETLPVEIKNLRKVSLLQLEGNQLKRLPEGFSAVGSDADAERIRIELAQNQLTRLPSDFGLLKPLEHLNLEDNLLTALPESFGKLDIYGALDLQRNKLKILPDSFGQLTFGKDGYPSSLYLDDNALTDIPRFGPAMHVISLSLRNNELSELPEWFEKIPDMPNLRYALRSIDLSGNSLEPLAVEELKRVFAAAHERDSFFTGPEITFVPRPSRARSAEDDAKDARELERLERLIGSAWDAGRAPEAEQGFAQWFTIAESLQKRHPGSRALNSWIAAMRVSRQDFQFDTGIARLEQLAQAVSDAWQHDNLRVAQDSLRSWLALSQALRVSEPADRKALDDWMGQMKALDAELAEQLGAQNLWSALERGSVEIAAALELDDIAAAQRAFTKWFSTADTLSAALGSASAETKGALARWRAEMEASSRALADALTEEPPDADRSSPTELP